MTQDRFSSSKVSLSSSSTRSLCLFHSVSISFSKTIQTTHPRYCTVSNCYNPSHSIDLMLKNWTAQSNTSAIRVSPHFPLLFQFLLSLSSLRLPLFLFKNFRNSLWLSLFQPNMPQNLSCLKTSDAPVTSPPKNECEPGSGLLGPCLPSFHQRRWFLFLWWSQIQRLCLLLLFRTWLPRPLQRLGFPLSSKIFYKVFNFHSFLLL